MKKIIACFFIFLICCSCSDLNLTNVGKDYNRDLARYGYYLLGAGMHETKSYVDKQVYYVKNIEILGINVTGCATFPKAEQEGHIETIGTFLTNSRKLKRELSTMFSDDNIYAVFYVNLKDDNSIEIRFNRVMQFYNHKTGQIIE